MNQPLIGGHVGLAESALAVQPANGRTMSTPSARSGQRTTSYSRETAVAFVIDAVESTGAATRNDFDIDRIVNTAHDLADDWDLNTLQPETFWRIAATFIKQ
ncbi:hypothetical protein SAMN05421776_101753 [Nocardia farcinica]|uniref:Uncharacterized protein n=3 Tax=Nocardiaceae TaxID=85025 RepID=Q5YWJ1_NOCFA|nr:hypothetical protein CRM89_05980 [Nocardia sp. FDAARGOS_372]PFX04776.1 hypothetical protein CJ469_00184 [Nocardia farcinica]BAD57450.1 hypothetical protein NFA_26030 [Nocardia farcinica IFM 10152]PFX09633.1 hypothetical protein CJ468_01473 [Nocardia farcinica]CRY75738.1 Uncharacterised protein [Nocardia farcinica]